MPEDLKPMAGYLSGWNGKKVYCTERGWRIRGEEMSGCDKIGLCDILSQPWKPSKYK